HSPRAFRPSFADPGSSMVGPDTPLPMTIPVSISPRPLIASGVLMLSIGSSGVFAGEAATPEPHCSGLPIGGVEAESMAYQIPLPFGIGVTAYSAKQPVNIQDLQLGRNGNPP